MNGAELIISDLELEPDEDDDELMTGTWVEHTV